MPSAIRPKADIEVVAENIFTDREEPRRAFWNVYNEMGPGDFEIVDYYGVGGAGKTTLLKKLRDELIERVPDGKLSYSYFSFEKRATKEEFLFDLSRQMMMCNSGLSFPLFDMAFTKIAKDEGKDIDLIENKAKENLLENPLLETAIDVGSIFFAGLGVVHSVGKAVEYLVDIKHEKDHEKAMLEGEHSQEYKQILYQSASDNKEKLHTYFVKDVFDYFLKKDHPFVVFIDGYENLVSLLGDGVRSKFTDGWISSPERGLINIPNVLWVVGGREKLEWDESVLPSSHMHRIGDLSEKDSVSFFEKAGIDEELRLPLYKLTKGTPIYMDICVKTYKAVSQVRKPQISDFGRDTKDLANQYIRDMDKDDYMLMVMFSWFPNVWDMDLLEHVISALNFEVYRLRMESLLQLSLFERISDGYRLHGTFRNIVRDFSERKFSDRVNRAILLYYKEWLLNSDSGIYRMEKINRFVERLMIFYDKSTVDEDEFVEIANVIEQECYQIGDYQSFDRIMEILCRFSVDNDMSVTTIVMCQNRYNYNLYSVGQFDRMMECTKSTYEYSVSHLGEDNIYTLQALDNLANAYDNLKYYDPAIELQGKCYEMRSRILGEKHPDTLRSLNNLADTYLTVKQYEKARDLQKKCFYARKEVLGPEAIGTLRSMNNYACTLEKNGEYEEALTFREECYHIRCRVLGEEHPDTMYSLEAMALAAFEQDNISEASEKIQRCYEVRKRNLGEEHPVTQKTEEKMKKIMSGHTIY